MPAIALSRVAARVVESGPDGENLASGAWQRPAAGRRPAPPLGEAPRPRPAAGTRPGLPRVRNIRRELGTPARVAKPSRPGPGRPKGSSKGPAPRYLLPGEADMPRTTNTTLTRQKVKLKLRPTRPHHPRRDPPRPVLDRNGRFTERRSPGCRVPPTSFPRGWVPR
jgi:hypothetical protein